MHIGDGSAKDNIRHENRERLLHAFLDHVQEQAGDLVIAGDLFELLRYPLDRIVANRAALLDRFTEMGATFIPGNHDEDVWQLLDEDMLPHPFFGLVSRSFVKTIGGRSLKFMHGHEVDPFIRASFQKVGRLIGAVAYRIEARQAAFTLPHDPLTDVLLEVADQGAKTAGWVRRCPGKALRGLYSIVPSEPFTLLAGRMRTEKMLRRYFEDKTDGLYDVAVVGHTHKAGTLGRWYYNCGSWTGGANNYLQISPDGEIQLFDWDHHGAKANTTVLAV